MSLAELFPPILKHLGVRRTFVRGGVMLTVPPPRISLPALAIATPLILIGGAVLYYNTWVLDTHSWRPRAHAQWIVIMVCMAAGAAIAFALALMGAHRLRQCTTLALNSSTLTLVETGLFSPCHAEWNTFDVRDIGSGPSTTRSTLGQLEIDLVGGQVIVALREKPRHTVECVAENLRTALHLARQNDPQATVSLSGR